MMTFDDRRLSPRVLQTMDCGDPIVIIHYDDMINDVHWPFEPGVTERHQKE